MQNIVQNLTTLEQYLKAQKEAPELFRPDRCPNCGKEGLWIHGSYDRKTDRSSNSHDPIHIFRFFCPSCHCLASIIFPYS